MNSTAVLQMNSLIDPEAKARSEIDASAYVIAAAQAGLHADGRETFGYRQVVNPAGDEMLLEIDEAMRAFRFAEIGAQRMVVVRSQLPSSLNRREIPAFSTPQDRRALQPDGALI